jgi:hypothetical protein
MNMVFEGFVATILNHFLAGYVENLNKYQLEVSTWRGKRNGNVVFLSYCYNYL